METLINGAEVDRQPERFCAFFPVMPFERRVKCIAVNLFGLRQIPFPLINLGE